MMGLIIFKKMSLLEAFAVKPNCHVINGQNWPPQLVILS